MDTIMNTKKCWLILATFYLLPLGLQAQSDEPIGIVLAASGDVTAIETDGDVRQLQRRSALFEGDTITTAEQSRVQFRFNDNGRIALQPESTFFIETHEFNGVEDGTETASYELLRGGLQAITGIIGHTNKEQYNVSTPLANIGLRGTHWAATYCEGNDCSGNPPGLYGGVAEGGIDVCNSAGCTAVDADTYFYTPNTLELTQTLLAPPTNVFLDSPESDSTSDDESDVEEVNSEDTSSTQNESESGAPNSNANQNAINAVTNNGNGNGANAEASGNAIENSTTDNNGGDSIGTSTAIASEQISPVSERAQAVATAFDEASTPVAAQALERATAFDFSEGDDTVSDFSDEEIEELGNNGNGRGQGNINRNTEENSGGNGNNDTSGNNTSNDTSSGNNNGNAGGSSSNSDNSGNSNGNGNTSGNDTSDDTSPGNNNGNSGENSGNSGNAGSSNGNGNTTGNDTSDDDTSENNGQGDVNAGEPDSARELEAALIALFGDDVDYESNVEMHDRSFNAYWGRWSGPNSNGNNRDDHFAYSPDVTTHLPTEGSLSYQLLGATRPTDQIGKEGQVNTIEMLIDFTSQSIRTMSFDLETGTSRWDMSSSEPTALGNGTGIYVDLEGLCFESCAKRFESIPANGSTTVTILGQNAEGALGTYDFQAGSATATGAYILRAD